MPYGYLSFKMSSRLRDSLLCPEGNLAASVKAPWLRQCSPSSDNTPIYFFLMYFLKALAKVPALAENIRGRHLGGITPAPAAGTELPLRSPPARPGMPALPEPSPARPGACLSLAFWGDSGRSRLGSVCGTSRGRGSSSRPRKLCAALAAVFTPNACRWQKVPRAEGASDRGSSDPEGLFLCLPVRRGVSAVTPRGGAGSQVPQFPVPTRTRGRGAQSVLRTRLQRRWVRV